MSRAAPHPGPRAGVWLRRYLPLELSSNVVALVFAAAAYAASENAVAMAVAGTWGGSLGFYGLVLRRELAGPRQGQSVINVVLALAGEFGPAEALDSFLIRPALIYAATALTPGRAWGFVVGKLAADLCFYLPAIVGYELLRRAARRAGSGPAAAGASAPAPCDP